jgi:hypothetical protein
LFFLEHAALFSSPGALALGIDAIKRQQVKRIERHLKQRA